MLRKLETNWFYLENQLLDYIEANIPNRLDNIKQWLKHINVLPVQERILYLSVILRHISENHHKDQTFDKIATILQTNYSFDEQTFKAFEKSLHRWISVKGNEGI